MRAWVDACVESTGSSNVFKANGATYFWETSRKEHVDGAITGTVYKSVGDGLCRKAGSFRIEGDGTVTRAPAFLKRVKVSRSSLGLGVGSAV